MTRRLIVETPALSIAALTWGPDDGPLALLLHGFPDTAWTWRYVAPALAADGWRVVAPFSRGYAPTGLAPDGDYGVGALVGDVLALRAALNGRGDALLVGHDWGAITAYALMRVAPEAFRRVVTVSVPPVPAMQRVMRGGAALRLAPRQLRNSWYVMANQLPVLPERVFGPLVRKLWRDWSPGYDASADLAHVFAALPTGKRRGAAISYYRRLAISRNRDWMAAPTVPTLYLHGAQDGCLLPELGAAAGPALPSGSRAVMVEGAGHFVQLERADAVVEEIRRFTGQGT